MIRMATLPEYRNEAFADFTRDDVKQAMAAALDDVTKRGTREIPLVIGGERQTSSSTFKSLNPASPGQVLAVVAKAGEAEVKRALEAALRAFDRWRWVPARERAGLLLRVSVALRKRRHEFNAISCLEAGKTWPEADVEFAEAVD